MLAPSVFVICPAVFQVGLIPTCCGGTSLFEYWAPHKPGGLWENMVGRTQAAMEEWGPGARLEGIIWVQVRGGAEGGTWGAESAGACSSTATAAAAVPAGCWCIIQAGAGDAAGGTGERDWGEGQGRQGRKIGRKKGAGARGRRLEGRGG